MTMVVLVKLDQATLAPHADALVAMLGDSSAHLRAEVLQAMSKLEPATLAQHADAVVARLNDSDEVCICMRFT